MIRSYSSSSGILPTPSETYSFSETVNVCEVAKPRGMMLRAIMIVSIITDDNFIP